MHDSRQSKIDIRRLLA